VGRTIHYWPAKAGSASAPLLLPALRINAHRLGWPAIIDHSAAVAPEDCAAQL